LQQRDPQRGCSAEITVIAITHTGEVIRDSVAFKAYLESIKPKRFGRVKKKVAEKKKWQTTLKQVAAAKQQTEGK
jgi:tRNA(Leu) C34 or U34 (ribose-2'-O)-methylase TrmL